VPYAITYVIDMDGPQSIALQLGLADQPAGRGIYLSKSNFMAALLRELIISGELKPGVQLRQRDLAERFGVTETLLRRTLFEQTAGMYPELVTRRDLHVFLPPIGGTTLYIFGDPAAICDPARPLTCRIHDECNGSDVFGSDICTCRPYLTHGVEECIRTAQAGGAGLIVYNRKEGRALGEVTKFLVYNARKRQPGGDQAATYFARTECVAGVQDARFQQLMPDVIHWLGIARIDRLVSMSNLKYDALIAAGIEIGERVPLPPDLVPQDAMVEIEAKKAAGYFVPESEMPALGESPPHVVGRDIKDY